MNNELEKNGVAVLRGAIEKDFLIDAKRAANACFAAIEQARVESSRYGFTRFSYSVRAQALADFGLGTEKEIANCSRAALPMIGAGQVCDLQHSWVRKRFAPRSAPRLYQPNSWHQDGALGAAFNHAPGAAPPMRRMWTLWIPLDPCGRERPGLEFVRQPLEHLLHYTELVDGAVRARFGAREFWSPELEVGDAVVFAGGCLHRTHVTPEMTDDRLSLELRFFPVTMGA